MINRPGDWVSKIRQSIDRGKYLLSSLVAWTTRDTIGTTLNNTKTITIAWVCMNRGWIEPTPEEISKFSIEEVPDSGEVNPDVPQYCILFTDNLFHFQRIYPYHWWLTYDEAKIQGLLPCKIYMFNKKAADLIYQNRKCRRLNRKEINKLLRYSKDMHNNKFMTQMGSGYVGRRYADDWTCIASGDCSYFSFDDGLSYVWFNKIGTLMVKNKRDRGDFLPMWSVPISPNE